MKAVDILRDERQELSGPLEIHKRTVHRVRLGIPESSPTLELEIPVLDPGCFRSHEIVVVNRLASLPYAFGPAKIRNTATRRNPRACKSEYLLPRSYKASQLWVSSTHYLRSTDRQKKPRTRSEREAGT